MKTSDDAAMVTIGVARCDMKRGQIVTEDMLGDDGTGAIYRFGRRLAALTPPARVEGGGFADIGENRALKDMASALRNTPAEALRTAGYLDRAADMLDAVDQADMRAFGASDAACYLYPGADQQPERAAFCAGAAHSEGGGFADGVEDEPAAWAVAAERAASEAYASYMGDPEGDDGHDARIAAAKAIEEHAIRALQHAALPPEVVSKTLADPVDGERLATCSETAGQPQSQTGGGW